MPSPAAADVALVYILDFMNIFVRKCGVTLKPRISSGKTCGALESRFVFFLHSGGDLVSLV